MSSLTAREQESIIEKHKGKILEREPALNAVLVQVSVAHAFIARITKERTVEYAQPNYYISGGYDWVNDDPNPYDDSDHGTHCAGIVAAEMDNRKGIAGIAQVSLIAEKVLDENGEGNVWDSARGIRHAADEDGIGDTPYILDSDNKDPYPLMTFENYQTSDLHSLPPYLHYL